MAVPLSYNVRSLYIRRKLTILAVGGIALVIGVLIFLIAMANGFRVALSDWPEHPSTHAMARESSTGSAFVA